MQRFAILSVLALGLAALFTSAAQAEEGKKKGYEDISIADLKKAIAENKVTLIDVNGSDSWKAGHIPGAIDFESSSKALADKLPKDKGTLIVAYCGGPGCNAYRQGLKAAQELGYTNVKHLSAGISGWKNAGEKTEKGA